MDFKELHKKILAKEFASLYLLHGEEPYFIDRLTKEIEEGAIAEGERDFDQEVLYGRDTEPISLLSSLKQYPMIAPVRVVILKEAQDFKAYEQLEPYLANPSPKTIFVVAFKYKTVDARSKFFKEMQHNGVVFKSEKIKDYQLPDWIATMLKSKGFTNTSKVPHILAESIGNDLARIVNEIDKLSIVLPSGQQIDEWLLEKHVGISKEYNVFELTNAIAMKDLPKAVKIVRYFEANPKAGELVPVVAVLFKFFSQLMRIHFLENKSRESVASVLKIHPFVAGELLKSRSEFPPKKVAENIELLCQYDLKAKGVGNATQADGDLMMELVMQLIL